MPRRRREPVSLKIRLYPGRDDDLIAWLEGVNGDFGSQAAAVREALRLGIGQVAAPGGQAVDLGQIRQVVEAAIQSALTGGHLAGASAAPDDGADELLDVLSQNLIMGGLEDE